MKGMKTLMNETGKISNLNLVTLSAALALGLAFAPALAATIVAPKAGPKASPRAKSAASVTRLPRAILPVSIIPFILSSSSSRAVQPEAEDPPIGINKPNSCVGTPLVGVRPFGLSNNVPPFIPTDRDKPCPYITRKRRLHWPIMGSSA